MKKTLTFLFFVLIISKINAQFTLADSPNIVTRKIVFGPVNCNTPNYSANGNYVLHPSLFNGKKQFTLAFDTQIPYYPPSQCCINNIEYLADSFLIRWSGTEWHLGFMGKIGTDPANFILLNSLGGNTDTPCGAAFGANITGCVVAQKPGSGTGVHFTGYFDYVKVNPNASLKFSNNLSFDIWINIHQSLQTTILSNGAFTGWELIYNGQNLVFQAKYSDSPWALASTPIQANQLNKWMHVAGTYDNNFIKLYINGELKSTGNVKQNRSEFENLNMVNNFNIGRGYTYLGQPNIVPMDLSVDELRVWNSTLTDAEIKDRMCQKIKSDDSIYGNLVCYYNMDENTGKTLRDQSPFTNNGFFVNGFNDFVHPEYKNIFPTWATSGAGVADANAFNYNGPASATNLSNTRGDNLNIALTSGAVTGLQIYNVAEPPTITTGIAGLLPNSNYFGVVVDNPTGNPLTYNAVFNYGNITGITDESQLRLYRRDNPTDPTWEDSGAILDQIANTLTVTGTNTEYILGLASAPLPVNLISFSGKKEENEVKLTWKTANEKDFSHFEIEKSLESKVFEKIGEIKSNKAESYEFFDGQNSSFITYHSSLFYRLKMIDLDGKFSYSKIIFVEFDKEAEKIIIENPVHNGEIFLKVILQSPDFKLINSIGRNQEINIEKLETGTWKIKARQSLTGIYFLLINDKNKTYTRKLLFN